SVKLPNPYAPPTLEQLFAFVDFYESWYARGAGKSQKDAARRAVNAREVRFNIETKVNPGQAFVELTPNGPALTRALIESVKRRKLESRVDIQSFDWSTLKLAQEEAPTIRTSCLLGDFALEGEGNLRDENGNTPWLAGLAWPYRQTTQDLPA